MPETNGGPRIAGHRLERRLGGGHFGDVWRGEFDGRTVAIKVFHRRAPALRSGAFAQEALGRVTGPDAAYFPRVEAVDFDHDPPFIRMELVDARPLEELIREGSLPIDRRIDVARRVLEALAAVHRQNFVHGDLSPGNVLVTPAGDVKLIDVGCGALFDEGARDIEMSGPAEDQSMGVAAPLYAAPERFRSEFLRGCGRPADVFSFGKLFYGLVTGHAPFVIKPVSRSAPSLAGWDDFVFTCLEEDPARRFADAGAALAEFDRILRPASRPGEYRAVCPECGSRSSVPGGWEGERYDCAGCGLTLEVLFYDEEARHASTAVVAEAPNGPDVEFLDDPSPPEPDSRARKFCPSCGRGIWVEARKCRHCGVWVDDAARALMAARDLERTREREAESLRDRRFVAPAVATFLAYFLFWLPGAILNWEYLRDANLVERATGISPSGHGALKAMMVLFTWIPVGVLMGLVGVAVLFGALL